MDATYKSDLREMNDANFAKFDAKLEQRLAEVRGEMYAGFSRIEKALAETRADLIKWSFVFWVGTVIAVAGPLLALLSR